MGKKYYMKDGKKIFINDEDLKDAEGEEKDEEVDTEDDEDGDDVEAKAKAMAKEIVAGLGLDQVSKLTEKVDNFLKRNQPTDSKLMNLLNGKDYTSEAGVASLTKEERIAGFFHALVTRNDHALKALSGGVAADGGNLLPQDFMNELNRNLVDLVVMRKICRVVPMKRDVMVIPRVTNSVAAYWTAENAAKTTTTANFTQDTLTARKMAAILYASDELVQDASDSNSFDIVQLIITLFAEAISMLEEQAFMTGNGTTQPTGLETARTAATIASISAAGAQNFDSVIRLEHLLKPQYRANAVFLCNDNTLRTMRTLKDSQNRYLWQDPPNLTGGVPATFHGYPVYTSLQLPDGVIYFGDFKRGYWIGDRKQMSVKVTQDSETAFTKDQTAIRVVQRVAGNVVLPAAIKVLTGF